MRNLNPSSKKIHRHYLSPFVHLAQTGAHALTVGGALIAIELLVYILIVVVDARSFHLNRHPPAHGDAIDGLSFAVSV